MEAIPYVLLALFALAILALAIWTRNFEKGVLPSVPHRYRGMPIRIEIEVKPEGWDRFRWTARYITGGPPSCGQISYYGSRNPLMPEPHMITDVCRDEHDAWIAVREVADRMRAKLAEDDALRERVRLGTRSEVVA
jgi:hypothetical protein